MDKSFLKKAPTEQMKALLRSVASADHAEARLAMSQVAVALTLPLQQGIFNGNIFQGIFEAIKFEPGVSIEMPYDFISPGTERNFVAYVVPRTGGLPEKAVEGECVTIPMYEIAASLDWTMKYMRDARWDIVGRALQVLEAMLLRKMNTDAWRVLLAAGKNRNLMAYDPAAVAGQFSKGLLAAGEVTFRRNSGGNSASLNRGKLTNLFISPESKADMFSWNLSEVPDTVRTKIFNEGSLARIMDVEISALDELGVGQEFDKYFTDILGGTCSGSKLELGVGLDLQTNATGSRFVMPYRQMPEAKERLYLQDTRRVGIQAFAEIGFSVLDNRGVLLFAI